MNTDVTIDSYWSIWIKMWQLILIGQYEYRCDNWFLLVNMNTDVTIDTHWSIWIKMWQLILIGQYEYRCDNWFLLVNMNNTDSYWSQLILTGQYE